MPNLPETASVLPQNLRSVNASASHISAHLPRYGARFHLSPDDPPAPPAPPSPPAPPAPPVPPAPDARPPADGPQAYRPEGLPDHLFGKSDKETIDKLNGAVTGFRKSEGERGVVPDKPDAYSFEPSDKLKPYVANFDKDPVYAATRDFAMKAGMTDKVFKAFMPSLLEHLVDGGLVAAPIDAKAMLRTMAPAALASATDAEKETAGARRVQDNIAWADGAKANQALPEDIASFLSVSAADNPAANKLIEWLRGANGETMPAMGGSGGSGLNDAQMKDRINDPRNNPSSPKFDRAFQQETDRLSQKQYG